MRSIVNRPQDSSGTQEHNSDEQDSQLADMQWSGILVYDVQYAQLEDLCCWNMALHQKNNNQTKNIAQEGSDSCAPWAQLLQIAWRVATCIIIARWVWLLNSYSNTWLSDTVRHRFYYGQGLGYNTVWFCKELLAKCDSVFAVGYGKKPDKEFPSQQFTS